MQYRKMGKLDFDVSNFGMGLMRLPTAEGNANIRYDTWRASCALMDLGR